MLSGRVANCVEEIGASGANVPDRQALKSEPRCVLKAWSA